MDWNWFFSTLAQCNAAFIGIIVSAILLKIQRDHSTRFEYDSELKKLMADRFSLENINMIEEIKTYNYHCLMSNKHLIEDAQLGNIPTASNSKGRMAYIWQYCEHCFDIRIDMAILDDIASYQEDWNKLNTISSSSEEWMRNNSKRFLQKFVEFKRNFQTNIAGFQSVESNLEILSRSEVLTCRLLYALFLGFIITVIFPLLLLPYGSIHSFTFTAITSYVLTTTFAAKLSMVALSLTILSYAFWVIREIVSCGASRTEEILSRIKPEYKSLDYVSSLFLAFQRLEELMKKEIEEARLMTTRIEEVEHEKYLWEHTL